MTYDFVKITSPVSGSTITTGDVNLKVNAYKPDQVTKMEYYINDQDKGTLSGSNGVYNIQLSNTLFNDGVNKIGIKASSKDLTYTDFIYVNVQKDQNKILKINIKDINGNNVKAGTPITLSSGDENTVESKVDKDGNAYFYNLDSSKTYQVLFIYNMNNSDGTISPVYYKENVNGTGNYNLSMKSAKMINISGYDENNKILYDSNLEVNGETYSNVFNSSGIAKIYVYNYDINDIELLNDNGYIYTKKYDGNDITFKVDDSVSKVTFNNSFKLDNMKAMISCGDDYDSTDIDLSNKNYVYATKGRFIYDYKLIINSNNKNHILDYGEESITLNSSEKTVNYSKPEISISQDNDMEDYNLNLNYNCKDSYGHILNLDGNEDANFNTKVYDASGKQLSSNNYTSDHFSVNYSNIIGINLNNVSDGKYKVEQNISIPIFQISTIADFNCDYKSNQQSGTIKLVVMDLCQ